MIIHEVEQRSVDWAILRAGIPTASEFDQIISPTMKVRDGEMPRTYLTKKLAEWWMGGPLASLNTFDMDQGNILEEEALPWYEGIYDVKVQRVGFITDDHKTVGCSPDGWIELNEFDSYGIEIKCPAIHTHIGYLMAGTLPKEYVAQVHGSMFVTGAPQWKFFSYCRGCPKLLLTIPRNEEIQEAIAEAVDQFGTWLDTGKSKLIELNGGPPKRFQAKEKKETQFVSETPT